MPALNKVPEPQKASEGTCFSKRFLINFSDAIFMFIGFLNNRPVLFRILLQGGLDPNKISGLGVDFGHLVRCLLLGNKDAACKPSMIFR